MKTAVDYLVERLAENGILHSSDIAQAKEMEKQQMIELWNIAVTCESFEQYYNETYGGEDESI